MKVKPTTPASAKLYEQVAAKITDQINQGILKPGQRLPSVRRFSRQWNVSVSTVIKAYWLLENGGFLESRPQSGFYVRSTPGLIENPRTADLPALQSIPPIDKVVSEIRDAGAAIPAWTTPENVCLGIPFPDPHMLPASLANSLIKTWRQIGPKAFTYNFPPGSEALRLQLARHYLDRGMDVSPGDIVPTSGCNEAIDLSLRSVVRPGNVVAVETPCFFGYLMILKALQVRVVEIPSDPKEGMDLDILRKTLRRHPVKACLSMPNFQVPFGSVMPDSNKQRLVEMLAEKEIPLIESDLYGDIYFGEKRPKPAKAFDKSGLVMLCSSFSKSLAPGLRIGWAVPGRWMMNLYGFKVLVRNTSQWVTEEAVAAFMSNGSYERHLRHMRKHYFENMNHFRRALMEHFPEGIRVSLPQGGTMLWVELPKKIDVIRLYQEALRQKIYIIVGHIFSMNPKYVNHLSFCYAEPWSRRIEKAIQTLGILAKKQLVGKK